MSSPKQDLLGAGRTLPSGQRRYLPPALHPWETEVRSALRGRGLAGPPAPPGKRLVQAALTPAGLETALCHEVAAGFRDRATSGPACCPSSSASV